MNDNCRGPPQLAALTLEATPLKFGNRQSDVALGYVADCDGLRVCFRRDHLGVENRRPIRRSRKTPASFARL
jgi:hypothetical protein